MYAITGGGTGGHLSIAKALAAEFKQKGEKVIFIGSKNGQDRLWFERESDFDATYFLDTTGVVNKKGIAILKAMLHHFLAFLKIRKIFKHHKIGCVISVGGYSAAPASIGAIIFLKKLFIHEQNAIKGRLNQFLSLFAKRVFSSFKIEKGKATLVSYPVNLEFFLKKQTRKEIKTILFLGGSQGAVAINDFVISHAKSILNQYNIIHQCGQAHLEKTKEIYAKMNLLDRIQVLGFEKNLSHYIELSDLCVCRAGASTVWELAANGLPAIYIPYPYAANKHQHHNASFFEKRNLGIQIQQEDLNEERFFKAIESMSKNLQKISLLLQESIQPGGAEKIAQEIILLTQRKSN